MSGNDASSDVARTVARNVKRARLAAGLTQRELADELGGRADFMTVSRWERGEHRPSDAYLVKLSAALGRELAWFFVDHEKQQGRAA